MCTWRICEDIEFRNTHLYPPLLYLYVTVSIREESLSVLLIILPVLTTVGAHSKPFEEKKEGRKREKERRREGASNEASLCFHSILQIISSFCITTTIYPVSRDWSQITIIKVYKFIFSHNKSYIYIHFNQPGYSCPFSFFYIFLQIIFTSLNTSTWLVTFIDSISRVTSDTLLKVLPFSW